jgi:hypothetical protein
MSGTGARILRRCVMISDCEHRAGTMQPVVDIVGLGLTGRAGTVGHPSDFGLKVVGVAGLKRTATALTRPFGLLCCDGAQPASTSITTSHQEDGRLEWTRYFHGHSPCSKWPAPNTSISIGARARAMYRSPYAIRRRLRVWGRCLADRMGERFHKCSGDALDSRGPILGHRGIDDALRRGSTPGQPCSTRTRMRPALSKRSCVR